VQTFTILLSSALCLCSLLLAQRKLTYTTAANQGQQSVLLPATSSQCMLEPYGQTTGAVAASEVDKAPLVWQQRLTSSDALQNSVDMQGHTNSLSQVSHMFFNLYYYGCISPRSSCWKFSADDCVLSGHAWQSTASSCKQTWRMLLLVWMLSANFWSSGTVMENTWKKDYVVAAIMGEACPGVTTPHFLAVWRFICT